MQLEDPEDPNAGNVRSWALNSPHAQRQAVWILAGGDSVERQASLAAGQHVLQHLLMQPDIQVISRDDRELRDWCSACQH